MFNQRSLGNFRDKYLQVWFFSWQQEAERQRSQLNSRKRGGERERRERGRGRQLGEEEKEEEGEEEREGCLNHVAAQHTGSKQTAKMSAPDEDTFAEEGGEMEEMDEAGSDEDEGVEMEEDGADGEGQKKVYVPGIEPLKPGEELEMDRSAYRMYHECQTGESGRQLWWRKS